MDSLLGGKTLAEAREAVVSRLKRLIDRGKASHVWNPDRGVRKVVLAALLLLDRHALPIYIDLAEWLTTDDLPYDSGYFDDSKQEGSSKAKHFDELLVASETRWMQSLVQFPKIWPKFSLTWR